MDKFTYILGAGASFNALPLAKSVKDKNGLPKALGTLNHDIKRKLRSLTSENSDYIKEDIENLLWLSKKSEEFDTVDIFAKFCYIKNPDDLIKIKRTLSFFFTIKQIIDKKIDKRYLVFLTTILQKNLVFPKEINILTWNWDYQIQIASKLFRKEKYTVVNPVDGSATYLQPIVGYYPCIGDESNKKLQNFSLVHLNGIAGFHLKEKLNFVDSILLQDSLSLDTFVSKIRESEQLPNNPQKNLISFAWESNPKTQMESESLAIAKELIRDTNYLIVIGYSFPFFNREIDRELFNSIENKDNFKKIYFQNPVLDGQFLKNQFELPGHVNIIHESNVDQFFIPFEL